MTLDFGSHTSTSGGVWKALERANDVGATSCQIFTKNERQWKAKPLDPEAVVNFKQTRERLGIGNVVVHDSYLINLASPKEDLVQKSLDAFQDELERAGELGIGFLVTHPGAHTGSGVEAGIQRFANSMNEIHRRLPDCDVMTLLETTAGQGTALGRTFEELAAIIDLIEDKQRVGVCLDTCHVFAAGYDVSTSEGVTKTLAEFDSVIGLDRLKVLHINDSKMPLGSNRDRHAHIGEGDIGLDGFRAIVNHPALEGVPGILETEKEASGDNDRRNLKTLRDLVDPDA